VGRRWGAVRHQDGLGSFPSEPGPFVFGNRADSRARAWPQRSANDPHGPWHDFAPDRALAIFFRSLPAWLTESFRFSAAWRRLRLKAAFARAVLAPLRSVRLGSRERPSKRRR